MNKKLETIHEAFPFFNDGSFYIATPEGHFDDPADNIMIAVWGDQFKVSYNGPGEYQETIYDTAEEVIGSVTEWLEIYNNFVI
jgi:hypothetical protein